MCTDGWKCHQFIFQVKTLLESGDTPKSVVSFLIAFRKKDWRFVSRQLYTFGGARPLRAPLNSATFFFLALIPHCCSVCLYLFFVHVSSHTSHAFRVDYSNFLFPFNSVLCNLRRHSVSVTYLAQTSGLRAVCRQYFQIQIFTNSVWFFFFFFWGR